LAPLGTAGSGQNPENPNPATPSTELASRRSLRAQGVQAKAPARVSSAAQAVDRPASSSKKTGKKVKGGVINIAVMTLAAGLIGTMAIPAYAFNPQGADSAQFKTSTIDGMKKAQPQSVQVPQTVVAASVAREAVSATSEQQLISQKQAAAAQAAAELARQQAAVALTHYATSYTGPSVSQFLANPPYPQFSLAQVFSVAKQYIGTPYVFGGSTPAGFDCSGYVMYVYAQFGINLPHSVSGEAARGTRISTADAQPGDLVVMSGHIGFYAGNGNIMDAPDSGRSISIRPIWTSDYYIVRLGI
jgi:cell wall-associated NlpC family hydrolase